MVEKKALNKVDYDTLTMKKLIEELLNGEEELRGNDEYLAVNVWSNMLQMAFEGEVPQELLENYLDIFSNWYKLMNLFNLPSYDTITRIRRDIQKKHPELKPKEPIKALRKKKQERIENDLRHAKDRAETNAWLKQGEQLKHE